jgi:glutaredoxin 3
MSDLTSNLMSKISMYSTETCPYCERALALFERKGLPVKKILVDQSSEEFDTMVARTGLRTVPQIFIGEHHVGGFTDLYRIEQNGELEQLLRQ